MTHEQKLQRFAELLHQAKLERFGRDYPGSKEFMERECAVHIRPGTKYTKVDIGTSGVYMVDAEGHIYGIKGYGVIHRGHYYGTLDEIEQWNWGPYQAFKRAEVAA